MRFAISLLTVLMIASIIGTVLKQNEPFNNYVNQFGQFWFTVFDVLALYSVYNAWWFLLILAFLVISTSLCVYRNAPKFAREMRVFREETREKSLSAFHHKGDATLALDSSAAVAHVKAHFTRLGWKFKVAQTPEGNTLVAAKAGSASRLGYIFAHVGMVVIFVGGLADSELPLKAMMALQDKVVMRGNPQIAEVPAQSRLPVNNPTFRGNVLIAEGGSRDFAVVNHGDGLLLQELPFSLKLNKFVIEHYSTGQPKLFLSEVALTDKATGKTTEHKIEVNKPLIHGGIAIYQSSFDDGGSKLNLLGYPMTGAKAYTFDLKGEVGDATQMDNANGGGLKVEFTGFRFFNIENAQGAAEGKTPSAADNERTTKGVDTSARPADGAKQETGNPLTKAMGGIFGTKSADPARDKRMQNVGPSVQYKIRDAQGQAREYHNYMLPMTLEGKRVMLTGMRENPNEAFRYLRLPMDKTDSVKEFMRLRAALFDEDLRRQAGLQFAAGAVQSADAKLKENLALSATRALETFAGRGFSAVAEFIDKAIPQAEQEKAAGLYLRILNGAAWELYTLARAREGLAAAPADEFHGDWLQASLNAFSDSFFYQAPVYLTLQGFDEVKASVFQLTRSPGKNIVYLGCLLLVLGVFAMFYIRERRAWVLVKSGSGSASSGTLPEEPQSTLLFAMSTNRKTMEFEQEFARHKAALFEPR